MAQGPCDDERRRDRRSGPARIRGFRNHAGSGAAGVRATARSVRRRSPGGASREMSRIGGGIAGLRRERWVSEIPDVVLDARVDAASPRKGGTTGQPRCARTRGDSWASTRSSHRAALACSARSRALRRIDGVEPTPPVEGDRVQRRRALLNRREPKREPFERRTHGFSSRIQAPDAARCRHDLERRSSPSGVLVRYQPVSVGSIVVPIFMRWSLSAPGRTRPTETRNQSKVAITAASVPPARSRRSGSTALPETIFGDGARGLPATRETVRRSPAPAVERRVRGRATPFWGGPLGASPQLVAPWLPQGRRL